MIVVRFPRWAILISCAAICCSGCGPEFKMAQVSGTVTLDGAPVGRLQVLFEPQDRGQPSSLGFTQPDGKYQLRCTSGQDGAAVGQHIVRVTPVEVDDPEGPPLTIPEKYNISSQLNFEVKPGENTIDLPITRR
jgi:hypothetical protein